ncbi:MAG: hypothetical protein ABSA47_01525 [Verrucomicrobiota bacterium]|jgi:DNA-directed RNA polymerase subunit RPC12/RpoP
MNGYKYSCPYCGQHIEYTDVYSGQRMPCPTCGHAIVFPAIPSGMTNSSLSLAPDIPDPVQKPQSHLPNLLRELRESKHWNVVGICLLSVALLGGAVLVASQYYHSQPTLASAGAVPPAGPVPGTADNNSLPVDPPPAPVAADPTPPSQPAPAPARGGRRAGRGGRGGRQGGQQAGARGGRQARGANPPTANNNNQ